jgi:3-oxoacyl-(acyl-carrier-protein) synthase
MMKPVYILSASAISPQHSFGGEHFLQPVMSSDNGKLYVVDADYRQYINPVAIRRMSKVIKMGISAAMNSLQQAGMTCPDAVITGTGMGSMLDMERFLKDMIALKEEALNPTYFIQSTYNSINGWVALQTKCNGYNQTFVHRGLSLELSLLDAQLLLDEADEKQTVLVGCFDEMTEEYFFIKNKIGYWKKDIPNSLELLKHNDTAGTIGGEGAAFFTLSNEKANAVCAIKAIRTFQDVEVSDVKKGLQDLLAEHNLSVNDIDVMLCGMNGDSRQQALYDMALAELPDATVAVFKHLTGEYATTSGFALWLASELFRKQTIPQEIVYRNAVVGQATNNGIKHMLVVNHYITGSVSLTLLSAVL